MGQSFRCEELEIYQFLHIYFYKIAKKLESYTDVIRGVNYFINKTLSSTLGYAVKITFTFGPMHLFNRGINFCGRCIRSIAIE